MAYGMYEARCDGVAFTTGITVLQVVAPSTAVLEVVRWKISQSNLVAAATGRVKILRKSAAATVTAFTPAPLGGWAAAASTAGHTATVEGTDSTVLDEVGVAWLAGYEWVAVSEMERIIVPPSGVLALKLTTAPAASTTINASIVYIEKS